MHRSVLVALLSFAVAAPAWGDEPTLTPSAAPSASAGPIGPSARAINDAFDALVMLGDKAHREGHIKDAITAYQKALALRDDAVVTGRLGVLYAVAGAPEMATRNLLVALERGGGSATEKDQFFKTFKRTRPLVCLLHVLGNVFDAEVSIDEGRFRKELGPTFKIFVMPGKHVIRGRASNGDEALTEQNCPQGGEETAVLQWNLTARTPEPPSPVPEEPPETVAPPPLLPPDRLLREKVERDPMATAVDEPGPRDEAPRRDPIMGGALGEGPKKTPRGALGVGPVVVFGVASWAPAVGATITGSLRLHEHVSIDLDGRAAWLASGLSDRPISAMTAGGLLAFCGHWKMLFGCAVGHLGTISIEPDKEAYKEASFSFLKIGGGARVGARLTVAESLSIHLIADVLGLTQGTRVAVGQTIIAEQPPILVGTTLGAAWQF